MNVHFEKLELNKILLSCANYAVLESGKKLLLNLLPSADLNEVRERLNVTEEGVKLLYEFGVPKIAYFDDISNELKRAAKGSTLTCKELLNAANLMASAKSAYLSVVNLKNEQFSYVNRLVNKIYIDDNLLNDITEKIISEDTVSDYASDRLFSIRRKIKSLNESIRAKLAEYVSGKNAEYLQDGIVTIRNDRFVIPVKAEHKNHVKGFIHDRSKTGATFFIEPEQVLELNNDLTALILDEREEVEAILKSLSNRLGGIKDELIENISLLSELDAIYARAEYAYALKCVKPVVNGRGIIKIKNGRHPLIDKYKVVPVSIELGEKYKFLLLSGANTGGKTVTLKMTGLFCLMAACGMFIPAAGSSEVAVFDGVYCDVGDSQSIEDSLSTFSSHVTNVIDILNAAGGKSLVLIDELGGGTNPDEGQALAKAVIKTLLDNGASGVVTTHFTPLKEFAYEVNGIENASMEFDSDTLKPLYRIKIGLPGSSNALAISRRLGMNDKVLALADSFLSEGVRSFENIMRRAEDTRIEAESKLAEVAAMRAEWQDKLSQVNAKINELNREREKLNRSARSESRRIIAERTERAEEILAEIEEIFKKEELSEADLIAARTLKNKIKDVAYDDEQDEQSFGDYIPATAENLKAGVKVYVKAMDSTGVVISFSPKKGEAEVLCGNLKMHLRVDSLLICSQASAGAKKKTGKARQNETNVKVVKRLPKSAPVLEINVLGLTVPEALYEVDNFIDSAVTDNLDEVKIIHGVGTGKLKRAIWEHLKNHKNVSELRLGAYGEGETGVTFVKLK